MSCRQCGEPAAEHARYCEACGAPLAQREGGPAPEAAPLTTGQCVCVLLAFCVPVLNWILMIRWAYGEKTRSESLRSLARAALLLTGVCIGAVIIGLIGLILAVRLGLFPVVGVI